MFKDKELREAARNEEKYIETVIGQHYKEIYKYCCRHLSQKEYAEDNGYHLWTNTQGEGDIHLLALHGGPGGNHEYWEDAAEQLKKQGLNVQVTMYDQLGSLYSDQPDYSDPEIAKKYLTYEYFLDEVDEVREKLGLDNFYLIGQSWGGLLVQEYAVKYGQHLKGAIISSMVDEIDEYVDSVNRRRQEVLPQTEIDFMHECEKNNDYDNQRYQDEYRNMDGPEKSAAAV